MEKGIRVSEKHGLNAMVTQCFLCGGDKNEIALLGRLKDDAEAPRRGVIDTEPCDECKSHMARGFLMIGVKDGSDHKNPYRIGRIWVIREEAAKQAGMDTSSGCCFIEESAAKRFGLPFTDGRQKRV